MSDTVHFIAGGEPHTRETVFPRGCYLFFPQTFLVHVNVSYFATLHQRNQFFSNKSNSYSFSKRLKCCMKLLTLKLFIALFYCSGSVRNQFLNKTQKYLPTEDVKPFCPNG